MKRKTVKTINLSNLVTLAEAARRKGVVRQRIWAMVQAGVLTRYEIGGQAFVDINEVLAHQGKPGRPKQKPADADER